MTKILECSNRWPWIYTEFWTGWRNLLCQAQKLNCPMPSTKVWTQSRAKDLVQLIPLYLLMISCGVSSVFNSALRFNLNHPACVKHKVRKFRPDTEHEQEACRQFYGCDSASAGFASLDFTSLGVVLILRRAYNSSTMALRDFFVCFVFTGDS